jgi:ABC-type nitrate/sulfonate/bicarbonate transport system ATPase subunit
VVAWMYTKLLASLLRMRLESDSLVGIVCHDVHEHLLLSQNVTLLAVTEEPESWRLVVKVICNT